jgi:hypothetical protein
MADQDDVPVSADAASDDTLPPSEATDSDELRNDDGDEMVTAPDRWLLADEGELPDETTESLDDKLAAEEPDAGFDGPQETLDEQVGEVEVSRRHRGQVAGSSEDGDSFFPEE